MKNSLKRTLAIFSMILFLSISWNGILARADDKVEETNTSVSSGSLSETKTSTTNTKADNTSTNDKTNTDTKDKDTTKVNENNLDLNASGKGTTENSTSNTTEQQVKDSSKVKEEIILGWQKKDGKLYYFTKDGMVKKTGWFKEKDVVSSVKNNNVYYLDENHAATIGWKKLDNFWYYFDQDGIKQTGWKEIEGYWYYLDKNGIMDKGWIKVDGITYYLNSEGKMVIGKQYMEDKWYFFKQDGSLQTGFYTNNGKEYYSDSYGVMVTNKWINTKSQKYYVKADSSLATGDAIIDNKAEKFDAYGKYIGPGEMKEHIFMKFLNVGDADSEFIKLPSGESVLIDTGTPETSEKIISFLKTQDLKKENGKDVIDYIVITHAHSDHIGGLASILKNFKVKKVYLPDIAIMKDWYTNLSAKKEDSATIDMMKTDYLVYEDAVKAMKDNKMEFTNTKRGEFIDRDKILQFVQSDKDFGGIGSEKISEYYWGLNDNSAIVYLNYGNLKALYTGDIQWVAERDFWKSDLLSGNKIDVLKVPHHGRSTSSTSDFIEYIKPSIGIVSRAKESIDKLDAYQSLTVNAVNLYETSEKDGVEIAATKDNWVVQNWN